MGQAFDEHGNPLGSGVFGDTKREVFDQLQKMYPDAHELRIKSLKDKLDEEEARLSRRPDEPVTVDAVDPHAASPGTPTTRDNKY